MKQKLQDEITKILYAAPLVKNLARKKLVAAFIPALIQSRNIQFSAVAQYLNPDAKLASNENRIQDFFREVELDFQALAVLLLSLLPKQAKLRVTLDRTEWDFGACQVNILMILVGYGDLQLPLFWELLDNNSGNSNSQNRIDLLERCFAVLDKKRVGLVVADREFVGQKWIKYLKDSNLHFVMRFPKHHQVLDCEGQSWRVEQLAPCLGKVYCYPNMVVDGCSGSVWLMRQSETEYLYLFGTVEVGLMGQLYRKRWCIETCFQNLKGRGFDLEQTHLQCLKKLSKLLALVSLTYALCLSLGIYLHRKVQLVKAKNHGYKANSFFRHGLKQLQSVLRPLGKKKRVLPAWSVQLNSLFRWLRMQVAHYQETILAG